MQAELKLIGERVKAARELKHLSQEKLAELSGVSVPQLSRIECGKADCRIKSFINVCNALELRADELLSDSVAAASRPQFERDLARVLEDCSAAELGVIADIAAATKQALRKQYE